MNRPIHIMGGGVAGLALGIALRRHDVTVHVIEAGDYPRHKVCGEVLAGVRPDLLEELGITEIFSDALRMTETAWFHQNDLVLRAPLPEAALGLTRYELDSRLSQRFQAYGGDLRTRTRAPAEQTSEGVVWATGRRPENRSGTRWLGMSLHARDVPLQADMEVHFGQGGYVRVTRLPRRRINISGLFRVEPGLQGRDTDLMLAYLQRIGLRELGHRLARHELEPQTFQSVTGLDYSGRRRVPKGYLSLGDSWALTPPFAGNGMARGLEHARLALPWLIAFARQKQDWNTTYAAIERQSHSWFDRRLRLSRLVQQLLIEGRSQRLIAHAARKGWVPFAPLYNLLTH